MLDITQKDMPRKFSQPIHTHIFICMGLGRFITQLMSQPKYPHIWSCIHFLPILYCLSLLYFKYIYLATEHFDLLYLQSGEGQDVSHTYAICECERDLVQMLHGASDLGCGPKDECLPWGVGSKVNSTSTYRISRVFFFGSYIVGLMWLGFWI